MKTASCSTTPTSSVACRKPLTVSDCKIESAGGRSGASPDPLHDCQVRRLRWIGRGRVADLRSDGFADHRSLAVVHGRDFGRHGRTDGLGSDRAFRNLHSRKHCHLRRAGCVDDRDSAQGPRPLALKKGSPMVSRKALVRRPSSRLSEGIVDHIERVPVDYELAAESVGALCRPAAAIRLGDDRGCARRRLP